MFKAVVTSSYQRVSCPQCKKEKDDDTQYSVSGYTYTTAITDSYDYTPSYSSSDSSSSDSYYSGGGGDFSGSGASGSWD